MSQSVGHPVSWTSSQLDTQSVGHPVRWTPIIKAIVSGCMLKLGLPL